MYVHVHAQVNTSIHVDIISTCTRHDYFPEIDLGKKHTRHIMFATQAQRRHFVNHRDVFMINLSRKVNHLSRIRHENNGQSVEEMVAELKEEAYNPYKRQRILDPEFPQLPADAFVVAFQTKFQKDIYEIFASTIACIHSTHKTNNHNFKLITLSHSIQHSSA